METSIESRESEHRQENHLAEPAVNSRTAEANTVSVADHAKPRPQRSRISGASLSELLASAGSDSDEETVDTESSEVEPTEVDAKCAEKLELARTKILEYIKSRRPRFMQAFELMTFDDNVIEVSVPTTELHDEILRNKTALLMQVVEMAGINGMVELRVTVNEEMRVARPIKLEDRVKYMNEKNPQLAELRKALDLDVE